LKKNNISKK